MSNKSPASQESDQARIRKRPNPTRKPIIPLESTPQEGSSSPGQNGGTNQRRTRGATALATQQQREAVDFVSGGTVTTGDNDGYVSHLR